MRIRKAYGFVFVIFACVLVTAGQDKRQVYQVCSPSTIESRFVYQFKPRQVVIEQGQDLDVEISRGPNKYLEQNTRSTNRSNNATVGGQDIVGDNEIRDYPHANIHFERPLTEVSLPATGWTAIVLPSNEDSRSLTTASERYVFPPRQDVVPVQTISPSDSMVTGRLGMSSMAIGGYWVTLMNTATISDQVNGSCLKTTPPVYVKIVPKPEPKPEMSVMVTSSVTCNDGSATLILTASPGLELDGSPVEFKRENVAYQWHVFGPDGNELPLAKNDRSLTIPNLAAGEYSYRVLATDGTDRPVEKPGKISVPVCRVNPPSNSGAGLVYFGFDVPYHKRDLSDYKDPEKWVECDSRVRGCTSGYPSSEFELFYHLTGLKNETPGVDTNTTTLNRIIDILNTPANSNLKVWIIGYADFKADQDYNTLLAERRITVVKNYLSERGLSARIAGQQVVPKNESNRFAQSCDCDNSAIQRRWDRRVEIIYIRDGDKIELPNYSPNNCSSSVCRVRRRPASTRKGRR